MLAVWYPLIKDNTNQSLVSSTISNSATLASDGKLGGCYKACKEKAITINYTITETDNFSYAFWFKLPSAIASVGKWQPFLRISTISNGNAGDAIVQWASYNQLKFYESSGHDQMLWQSLTYDVWHHLVVVHSPNKCKIYIDGELETRDYTMTNLIKLRSGNIELGWGIDASAPVGFSDVRIYTHALSPKEVKEIAKGLVLHYPLNDAYVEGTSNLFSANLTYGTNWDNSGSATWSWDDNTIPKINNSVIYSISRTDAGNSAIGCGRCNLVAGKTYTASVYVYLSGNVDSNVFYVRSVNTNVSNLKYNNDANPQKWPQNQWIRATATFTPSATYNNCYICTYLDYANSKRALTCWQIEEKDHATPYTPNTRNETTVYDCSGYQNNGTISGALSCRSDSPRYKTSTEFSAGNYIQGSFELIEQSTIVFWLKKCFPSGYLSVCQVRKKQIKSQSWYCGGKNSSYVEYTMATSPGYSSFNIPAPYDGWHQYCLCRNNGIDTFYVDGVIVKDNVLINNSSINEIIVGTISSSTSGTYLISDVRVYATALSEEDIKELYNTSAYVSDNGALLTYSVEE